MSKRKSKKTKKPRAGSIYRLAAVATVSFLMADPTAPVFAANMSRINNVTDNVVKSSNNVNHLFDYFAYISGCLLVVFGIFKLKQHVDHPGDIPMRQGMIRLAAAGMLLSLPFMAKIMQGTVSEGKNTGAAINHVVYFGTTGGAYTPS